MTEKQDNLFEGEMLGDRKKVAMNPNTPSEVLALLAGDKDRDVRYWVATNPRTPPEALDKLSGDKDADVRREVARNPNTSQKVLDKLAGDEDPVVRYVVVKNPNTPVTAPLSKSTTISDSEIKKFEAFAGRGVMSLAKELHSSLMGTMELTYTLERDIFDYLVFRLHKWYENESLSGKFDSSVKAVVEMVCIEFMTTRARKYSGTNRMVPSFRNL